MKALESMSLDELREVVAQKEKEENKTKAQKRKQYEADRSEIVTKFGVTAQRICELMDVLKNEAFPELDMFKDRMLNYGELRNGEGNKGNFQIENEQYRIVVTSQVNKGFDERADVAAERLRKFMSSFVKKNSQGVYKLVTALLEKNSATGEYDINLINRLYAMENDFDNDDWKAAIRLFKEAYNPQTTKRYIRFYKALPDGGFEPIVLDFAKIKVHAQRTEKA